MSRDEAMSLFRILVARYGLQWGPSVPREAYEQLAKVNAVLSTADRRMALGLRP